jgi:hypothetical protein
LIAKHQASGHQRDLVREHVLMASLRSAVGELTLAAEDAKTALRCARELGSEHHIAYAAATLCEASLRVGDMARAQSLVALSYTLPDHAITPLRLQHFRLLECVADFEGADFDSAHAKTQRLLEALQAYPLARTHAVARGGLALRRIGGAGAMLSHPPRHGAGPHAARIVGLAAGGAGAVAQQSPVVVGVDARGLCDRGGDAG